MLAVIPFPLQIFFKKLALKLALFHARHGFALARAESIQSIVRSLGHVFKIHFRVLCIVERPIRAHRCLFSLSLSFSLFHPFYPVPLLPAAFNPFHFSSCFPIFVFFMHVFICTLPAYS